MRVTATSRHNVRRALASHDVKVDLSDSQADALIRQVRKILASRIPTELAGEAQLMIEALSPIKNFIHSHVTPDLDLDEWATLLWDCYTASVNNTKAAAACEMLVGSGEAWSDMIVVLMNQPLDVEFRIELTWYSTRRMVALWLFSLCILTWFFPGLYESVVQGVLALTGVEEQPAVRSPGRLKVLCFLGGLLLLAASILWAKKGRDLLVKKEPMLRESTPAFGHQMDDDASIGTSSARLRADRDKLRQELDDLKANLVNPGQGSAAQPNGELMAALHNLSGASVSALPTAAAAMPASERVSFERPFFVGDLLVRVANSFLPAGTKRNQLGVLSTLVGPRAADVRFSDGTTLYMVPSEVLELGCLDSNMGAVDRQWFRGCMVEVTSSVLGEPPVPPPSHTPSEDCRLPIGLAETAAAAKLQSGHTSYEAPFSQTRCRWWRCLSCGRSPGSERPPPRLAEGRARNLHECYCCWLPFARGLAQ